MGKERSRRWSCRRRRRRREGLRSKMLYALLWCICPHAPSELRRRLPDHIPDSPFSLPHLPVCRPPPPFPFRRGQGAFQPLSWAGLLPTSGLKWDHHAATTLAQQGLLNAIEMEGRLQQPSVPWANLSSRR